MTHILRNDTRIGITKNILYSIKKEFDGVLETCKKDDFNYWDSIYADDTEHLVGTAFIVLQNYINSSISDLYLKLSKLHLKYSTAKMVNNECKTTRIELIIVLANYYKHRDLPTELHKHTTNPLDDLKIYYKEIYNLEKNKYFYKIGSDSPIFNGLSLLSIEWELNDLIEIVSEWREDLWKSEYKNS
ncbi:hypothetical protein [Putridiphycobacter roseus]|uniref:hypothetical protein n=1 Tax=Putridiphycobacter roseus TaxID=2219161 RepID=UPI00363BC930